jgi:dihydrofolate synthase/folylpolyglutamate synthase
MKRTLQDWLSWQESLHLTEIDLGLERIGAVANQLDILKPEFPVIIVAGTNGKGSTVAFLDEILRAQGYKTGAYTSPHLIHYNERILLSGLQASDADIIEAFEKIDAARFFEDERGVTQETSLTYFEFSTLAAMLCFSKQKVDVAIIEVGLGGRLDAANLWDTSVAIITSIGIDHIDWLGDDRELIAVEKSGIMRKSTPVVCGDPNPPISIKAEADRIGARLIQIGADFKYEIIDQNNWEWSNLGRSYLLAKPAMAGDFQLNNAATAIAALEAIQKLLPVTIDAMNEGLKRASVTGRMQIIHDSPQWLLDVAHNPHAARQLAHYIHSHPVSGKTYALFSMLKGKDIKQVLELMDQNIDEWHIVGLDSARGLAIDELKQLFNERNIKTSVITHRSFKAACESLKNITKVEDRVVAFGSFLVVSAVLDSCN